MLAVSERVADGDTIKIPNDADVTFYATTAGMSFCVYVHAIGEGSLREYDANVTDVRGSQELDAADNPFYRSVKHLKHERFILIELDKQ